jgi:hypothetical protein
MNVLFSIIIFLTIFKININNWFLNLSDIIVKFKKKIYNLKNQSLKKNSF